MGNEQYSLPSLPFLCFHDFDVFSSFLVKLQTVLVPSRLYLHSEANFSAYSSETNRPMSIWIFCILVSTIPPQVAPSFSHDIHFSLYSGVTADCAGATRPLVQHFHLGFQWESCNLTSVIHLHLVKVPTNTFCCVRQTCPSFFSHPLSSYQSDLDKDQENTRTLLQGRKTSSHFSNWLKEHFYKLGVVVLSGEQIDEIKHHLLICYQHIMLAAVPL